MPVNSDCAVHPIYFNFLQHAPGVYTLAEYEYWALHWHQFVKQWSRSSTEDLGYAQPQLNFPMQSSPASIQSSTTPLTTTTSKYWECFICFKPFHRRQERDRHEGTHLPYFLHCPIPHCKWRGNRTNLFKAHWRQDHRPYHQHYSRPPDGSQIETYDPWVILNQCRSGAISLPEAEDRATVLVQVRAYELQKPHMRTDPWGRSRKQASRRS